MIDWILNYWSEIFGVIGLVGTGCTGFVKIFGSYKWASALVKLCDYASVINTPANKAILEKAAKKNK